MTSPLARILDRFDGAALGAEIYRFVEDAFPICRSITGDGVRRTLDLLGEIAPNLEVREVPSGTPVFDWQVPPEWNVRGAWIEGPDGRRVVDFADHNLHLLGYSVPVDRRMSLEELRPHLFSLPEQPDLIPYRTSYYRETWGFCLPHRRLEALTEGEYRVRIDSTLEPGHLTYGEVYLPGSGDGDVHLSAHICHPSLANDNLSSLGVAAHLARLLSELPQRRYGYRFVFVPGTIGAITWLAQNRGASSRIRHGLVMANLGDGGAFCYKRSRRGNATIDRVVERVLLDSGEPHELQDFNPFGYDERQYCSPGLDLPVGLLSRTPWGRYPEYHTSGDDLSLVRPEHLGRSLRRYLEVVLALEHDRAWRNRSPFCEPQLGRRGLYHHIGGGEEGRERQLALLWVLNQSDGSNTVLDIAERSGLTLRQLLDAVAALVDAELLEPAGPVADGAVSEAPPAP
ncbi:MAG: DUF4910 domain-containing protein [Acidobacteriota bacterium]